jgi:hypothetical protein
LTGDYLYAFQFRTVCQRDAATASGTRQKFEQPLFHTPSKNVAGDKARHQPLWETN